MNRLLLAASLVLALAACPKDDDRDVQAADTITRDTTRADLSQVTPALPPPAADTFTRPKRQPRTVVTRYAAAPAPLMEAVERERAFSNFCYREFGLKSDPRLYGGVAMLVTVGRNGVTAARVADDTWSSSSGKAVNECLNQRAAEAWKIAAGEVPPGTYQVDLRFTGGT
jgi:hypothetical protein